MVQSVKITTVEQRVIKDGIAFCPPHTLHDTAWAFFSSTRLVSRTGTPATQQPHPPRFKNFSAWERSAKVKLMLRLTRLLAQKIQLAHSGVCDNPISSEVDPIV